MAGSKKRHYTVEEHYGMPVYVEDRTLPELPDRASEINDEGVPPGKRLRAGAARVDVTPSEPVVLQGYGNEDRLSTGVHDHIYIRAVTLDNGEEKAAFISADMIRINGGFETVEQIRNEVEKRIGIPAGNILIGVTHTHSSIGDLSVDKAVEAVEKAWENAKPARIGMGSKKIFGIGSNRRLPETGSGLWGSNQPNPNALMDNECGVIRIEDDQRNIIAVIANYPCHPSVLSADNLLLSGDYAGIGTQEMEKRLGGDAVAMFLQGCAGDSGTHTFRASRTIPEAEKLGKRFADAVLDILEHIDVTGWVPIACKNRTISLPRKEPDDSELPLPPLSDDGKGIRDEIQAIALNNTAVISVGSMEAYMDIGLSIKEESPFKHTFVVAYSNGPSLGYLPSTHAYEVKDPDAAGPGSTHFSPEAPKVLVEQSLTLLREVKEQMESKEK